MNKYYLCLIIIELMTAHLAHSQSFSQNFVQTEAMLDPTGTRSIKTVQYYDGFGRPDVLAAGGKSPDGKYVYTLTEYDKLGHEARIWLPAVGTVAPNYIGANAMRSMSQTTYSDDFAYSQLSYDAIDRPIVQTTPGALWHQNLKAKTTEYITNNNTVRRYRLDTNGNPINSPAEYYAAGSLKGERATDEDGHVIEVYKDILDNVVLERRKNANGTNNDTYYVYDKTCRLRYVLPPQCTSTSDDMLSKYAYKYEYDDFGNCEKKTLPGCAYIQYWHDTAGRVTFMQDARLRSELKYRFFLYDELGRMVMQGLSSGKWSNNSSVAPVRHYANTSGICDTGYSFTTSRSLINPQIEIVNYYDAYDFLSSPSVVNAVHADLTKPEHELATSLLTGCLQKNSDGSYTCCVNYYDKQGNIIDIRETVPGGGCTKIVTSYSFTNKPEVSTVTMTRKGATRTVQVTSTYYSATDKLHYVQHKYGTRDAVTTAEYLYDDLGQLDLLKQHNGAIETSYSYDLHGWLTDIVSNSASTNTTIFAEKLLHADGSSSPCYNGNISESRWATSPVTSYRYKYTYDSMDRMTAASFHAGGDISQNGSTSISDLGNVSVTYDTNSNIQSLFRRGKLDNGYGEIDHLTYSYSGNKLMRIDDGISSIMYEGSPDFKNNTISTSGYEYAYDGCGAMKYDANKGITKIEYDLLGNPKKVSFADHSYIDYVYSADGRRLKTRHFTAVPSSTPLPLDQASTLTSSQILSVDSTEYIGSFVFENNAFKQYLFDGGYITPSAFQPCKYYIKDHLGNNRILASHNGTVEQTTHYYPFGATHHLSTSQGVQKYKYNGKELDTMHGLNWYDYGARQYDPAIGQFTSMDPLCEKYYHLSPYRYCGGNPVNRVDLDGRSTWVVNEGNNHYKVIGGDLNDNDLNIYVYTNDSNGEYSFHKENWTRGESIGKTPLMTSFYNSDSNCWSIGSIINTQDQSGINFFNKIKNPNISLIEYMWKARNGHEYDFKVTNGIKNNNVSDIYRGMPFIDSNGEKFYTSARDIGNIAAGYKASASGIGWKDSEKAFDMYQSRSLKITTREGISTKNAEKYGYMLGHNYMLMRGRNPIINIATFIASFF